MEGGAHAPLAQEVLGTISAFGKAAMAKSIQAATEVVVTRAPATLQQITAAIPKAAQLDGRLSPSGAAALSTTIAATAAAVATYSVWSCSGGGRASVAVGKLSRPTPTRGGAGEGDGAARARGHGRRGSWGALPEEVGEGEGEGSPLPVSPPSLPGSSEDQEMETERPGSGRTAAQEEDWAAREIQGWVRRRRWHRSMKEVVDAFAHWRQTQLQLSSGEGEDGGPAGTGLGAGADAGALRQRYQQKVLEMQLEVQQLTTMHARELAAQAACLRAACVLQRTWRARQLRTTLRQILSAAASAKEAHESQAEEAMAGVLGGGGGGRGSPIPAQFQRTVAGCVRLGGIVPVYEMIDMPPAPRRVAYMLYQFVVTLPPSQRGGRPVQPTTEEQQEEEEEEEGQGQGEEDVDVDAGGAGADALPAPAALAEDGGAEDEAAAAITTTTLMPASPLASADEEEEAEAGWPQQQMATMRFAVRFSRAHQKHQAMESSGLLSSAFPPLTFPPHRPASRLRSTLLGQPSAAAQTRAAHRRAEELRQYFERLFRLAAVQRHSALANLVDWIGDQGPHAPQAAIAADGTAAPSHSNMLVPSVTPSPRSERAWTA